MRCSFSPYAERDLEEIGDYIARDNPRRAVSFIAELRERCLSIAQTPYGFPAREEFGSDIRRATFGRYLIFYRIDESADKVRVERILHAARDIDENFFH